MKIIKEYKSRGMKHVEYDHADGEILKKRFLSIDPKLIDRLCSYMKSSGEILSVDDCYDAQSGWQGESFTINGMDLSGNGYCLSNEAIRKFLEYNSAKSTSAISELFTKVRQWAHKKGIYNSGDLKTQTLKLTEEAGELAKAVLHNDKDEVKDAIGDCMVVLINVAELACDEFDDPLMSAEECLRSAYNVIKDRAGKMKDGNFVKDN